jgi:secreted PhoX family phosphatase
MRDHTDDRGVNPSSNPTFAEVHATRVSRRDVLRGGLGAAAAALAGPALPSRAVASSLLGFSAVPISTADTITVPPGYTAEVLYAWGDPISGDAPAFKQDATNTVADQERQAGMHHDGMHFFPLPAGSSSSTRGLLVVNHEYTDDGLLHRGGFQPWTSEKVAKSQAAHGVSVVEIALVDGRWGVRPSAFARRITARTPIRVDGPAAGHVLMRTAADPTGRRVLGTINNCAHGVTPWGTYLTCEENFNFGSSWK